MDMYSANGLVLVPIQFTVLKVPFGSVPMSGGLISCANNITEFKTKITSIKVNGANCYSR